MVGALRVCIIIFLSPLIRKRRYFWSVFRIREIRSWFAQEINLSIWDNLWFLNGFPFLLEPEFLLRGCDQSIQIFCQFLQSKPLDMILIDIVCIYIHLHYRTRSVNLMIMRKMQSVNYLFNGLFFYHSNFYRAIFFGPRMVLIVIPYEVHSNRKLFHKADRNVIGRFKNLMRKYRQRLFACLSSNGGKFVSKW